MFSRDLTTKTAESSSGFLVSGLRAAWSSQSSIVDGDDAMAGVGGRHVVGIEVDDIAAHGRAV